MKLTIAAGCLLALLPSTAIAADPTTGECLASYEKSLALKKQHELRAARAELLVCSSASCPADVRNECLQRVNEVDLATPTIVFAVEDETGSDLFDVQVTMDGRTVATRLDGHALPLDPGAHVFAFEVAGRRPVQRQLLISEGQKARRERVAIGPPLPPPPAVDIVPISKDAPAPGPDPARRRSTVAALALGAVGLAGVAVGATYGFIALSRRDTARGVCPTEPCKSPEGPPLWQSATSAGNRSTTAFVVGGVALASGATVWLLGRRHAAAATSPQVTIGLGFVRVSQSW